MLSVKDLKKVSDTTQLPTKPDQVAEAGRLGENQNQVFNFAKTKE